MNARMPISRRVYWRSAEYTAHCSKRRNLRLNPPSSLAWSRNHDIVNKGIGDRGLLSGFFRCISKDLGSNPTSERSLGLGFQSLPGDTKIG